MPGDWRALADAIRAARARRGWTQERLAAAAGIRSDRTIWDLESGRDRARWPNKMALVEAALGWAPGTARRIVYEGAPPPADPRPEDRHLEQIRATMTEMGLPEDVIEEQVRQVDEQRARIDQNPDAYERRVIALAAVAPSDAVRADLASVLDQLREARRARGCTCDRLGDDPSCPLHGGADEVNGSRAHA